MTDIKKTNYKRKNFLSYDLLESTDLPTCLAILLILLSTNIIHIHKDAKLMSTYTNTNIALSAGAVEYTNCFSAEG